MIRLPRVVASLLGSLLDVQHPLAPLESETRAARCVRCGGPGYASWHQNFCSLPDVPPQHYVFCASCDVEMNAASVRFTFGDTKETELAAYARFVERDAAERSGDDGAEAE